MAQDSPGSQDLGTNHLDDQGAGPSWKEAVEDVLDWAEDLYPDHLGRLRRRLNHVNAERGGVIVAAIVVCRILGDFLGF